MTRVVATGVFSIIHPGHIMFLEEAKRLGDELIVILARDRMVGLRKGTGYIPEKQRLHVISALKMVDKAILGDEEDMYKPIMELAPDIIALGKDQDFNEKEIKSELEKRGLGVEVVRITKYWEGELYSTRRIIERMKRAVRG